MYDRDGLTRTVSYARVSGFRFGWTMYRALIPSYTMFCVTSAWCLTTMGRKCCVGVMPRA